MAEPTGNDEKIPAFTIKPVEAAQHGPPTNVRFLGVLAMDPRLQHTSVPLIHRNHPLVKDHFFYTIPKQLLQSTCRPQVGESFEVDALLQLELELSQISGDHGSRVGFWNELPIVCNLMHSTPIRQEDLEKLGNLDKQKIKEILRAANERLASFSDIACGYAGWLMTNPQFLSELDQLLAPFGQQMQRWGTAMVGLPIPSSQPAGLFNPTGEEGWAEYDSAVLDFCVRWRLQGLAGSRIPIPIRPMMSGQFPLSIVKQLMRAGGVFNWPDTFPLYARDELRDLLASALLSSESVEHLKEWRSITDSKNKAKNQIATFKRFFRLQHFWRLLRERHPARFKGRLHRIEYAFADYLKVDVSTIQLDRTKIGKSLGKNWDQRGEMGMPDNPTE
jgi:hypothetical protein